MSSERILAAAAVCLCLVATPALAGVEWKEIRSLPIEGTPLAVSVTPDGQTVAVLYEGGEVRIFSPDGKLRDRLTLDAPADDLALSPRGDALVVSSKAARTVRFIGLDFIRTISEVGSPVKGPPDAPVTIAVFTDFQ